MLQVAHTAQQILGLLSQLGDDEKASAFIHMAQTLVDSAEKARHLICPLCPPLKILTQEPSHMNLRSLSWSGTAVCEMCREGGEMRCCSI